MKRINRSIRFSDEEFNAITKAAHTAGVERSKFIRDTAVNAAEVINQGKRPQEPHQGTCENIHCMHHGIEAMPDRWVEA